MASRRTVLQILGMAPLAAPFAGNALIEGATRARPPAPQGYGAGMAMAVNSAGQSAVRGPLFDKLYAGMTAHRAAEERRRMVEQQNYGNIDPDLLALRSPSASWKIKTAVRREFERRKNLNTLENKLRAELGMAPRED